MNDTLSPRCLVIAATRNEGAFLVEWVSWYRAMGFEVMVLTNDCTDHSPDLLDRLEAEGWLTHVRHEPNGKLPKWSAHRAARKHPLIEQVDWVMVCDVDEFLVLKMGDGTIQSIFGGVTPDFTGMAINWRVMACVERDAYEDVLVTQTFQRGAAFEDKVNYWFKSIFRTPTRFKVFDAHGPKKISGVWGEDDSIWVNSSGRRIWRYDATSSKPIMRMPKARVTHDVMQLNHYILRTPEEYAAKRGTASASAGKNRYTDDFRRRFHKPDVEAPEALTSNPTFKEMHSTAMALPEVARLHHLCCAERVERLCAVAGTRPDQDPRYRQHMAAATAKS